MSDEDLKLLMDWFENNKEHKLNFLEKEAIKLAVRKADTVGDLLKMALDLLKKLVSRNEGCRYIIKIRPKLSVRKSFVPQHYLYAGTSSKGGKR